MFFFSDLPGFCLTWIRVCRVRPLDRSKKDSLMHGSFLSFWKEAIRIGSPDQVTKRPFLEGGVRFFC